MSSYRSAKIVEVSRVASAVSSYRCRLSIAALFVWFMLFISEILKHEKENLILEIL